MNEALPSAIFFDRRAKSSTGWFSAAAGTWIGG